MVIRFPCGACGQPIEVDDEWAQKPVGCPYCRKTVTAPAASTFEVGTAVPMARPASEPPAMGTFGPTSAPAWGAPMPLTALAPASANTIAVVALILACTALSLLVLGGFLALPHAAELQAHQERAQEVGVVKASMELVDEGSGRPPGWLILLSLTQLAAILSGLAAVICAALGLRRLPRRGYAVAGLALGSIPIIMLCAGLLTG
ncbi:MAG TPA: hypothetical protein PKK06_07880 [Phycisphaerae bacterium]|nr:hypothetical protein [Phycisphaerae bacterium]HNU46044.1 hypothetical protein [Phycisphaerae bacterium]